MIVIVRYGYRWTQLGKNNWEVAWPSPRWTERRIYRRPPQWVAKIAQQLEENNRGLYALLDADS